MSLTFNSENHVIGVLCKRNHDWENSGKSLRRNCDYDCVDCRRYRCGIEVKKSQEKRRQDKLNNQNILIEQNVDINTFYLSKPCAKKHYWEGTRLTLRYASCKKCVDCLKEKHRAYYKTNAEKIILRSAEYYKTPRGKQVNEAATAKYRKTEKSKFRAIKGDHKRRARLALSYTTPYTKAELNKHLLPFSNRCVYCTKLATTLDHLLPISYGGSNNLGNLLPCCQSCNSSKINKDPKVWYEAQPFYSLKQWRFILKALGKTDATYNQLSLF